jgi:Ni/Co efflux regulator RcnB
MKLLTIARRCIPDGEAVNLSPRGFRRLKMKRLLLLAGAAAMLGATPALAEKPGKGHVHKGQVTKQVGHKASAKAGAKAKHVTRTLRDRNRNRIDDRDEALASKYGGALCPPGLAKKTPACMPPGQAKRLFREGQRLSTNYRYYTPYSDIPVVLRDRYDLDDDYRYIYRNNVIYTVDPRTRLITSIIDAIL